MSEDRKTQVLILDDEPIVWKRLKPAMEKAGYEVEAFSQSSHAMRRVQEKEFDIVVTDLKMEGIDGMAFMTEVKKRSPRTEVIVITGFATMETAKESFQKGVFDFLAKPFKRGELLEIVKKAEAKVRQ
ncbi:MAG: response regulator [Deltaproteobacteria bacterium]|mgnify:CR=1 FL=1|jgi:DNA-binding NtrC family response regulator|nr:response regulator [Deltaproteobacteria bacterium]